MAEPKAASRTSTIVKLVVSIAAIVVGLFLVFGAASAPVSDAVFVGSIAAVLAVYLWGGVTRGQARLASVVLVFLAAYAFVRGFGLLELNVLRQLGGITAIVSGVILLIPFLRSRFARPVG